MTTQVNLILLKKNEKSLGVYTLCLCCLRAEIVCIPYPTVTEHNDKSESTRYPKRFLKINRYVDFKSIERKE